MSAIISVTRITDDRDDITYGFECEEILRADGWVKAGCANTAGVRILLNKYKELEKANGNR